MRSNDLLKKLHDEPFKAFRVHLRDDTKLDVEEPGMVIVGLSSAVLPTRFGEDEEGNRIARDWRTIALAHIVQFTDTGGGRGRGRNNGRRGK